MPIPFRLLPTVLCVFFMMTSSAKAQPEPRCLKPDTAQYFLHTILPALKDTTEALGIYRGLQRGERIEDVLSFAYQLAVINLAEPLGAWNDEIKRRSVFYVYFLCPIESAGSLFALPEKKEQHVKNMTAIRPTIVKGAFYRLLILLSVKPATFQLSPEIVRAYGKLPSVSDSFNLSIITGMRSHDP